MISLEDQSKEQNGCYQEIQTGIFLISKCLGLFPINVRTEKLSVALKNVLISVSIRLVFYIYVFVKERMRAFDFRDVFSYRIFIFYGALCAGMMIAPVNLFQAVYNLERYSIAMKTLSGVDAMIGAPARMLKSKLNMIIFVTVCLVTLMYEGYFYYDILMNSPSGILYYQAIVDIFVVTSQFTSLVRLATFRFEFLCDTLNQLTLERWCQCQEMLCSFNKAVIKCYTSQLTFTVLSILLYSVSRASVIIRTEDNMIRIDVSCWILLILVFVWKICHTCRESVFMAKKFDDKLYRLVLKDKSKRLLRNKRIMLHFRAKRVEDFTAMGCFRFDFPLLCTIISVAVSSVLIMIQFS